MKAEDMPTPETDAGLIYVGGYYYVSPELSRSLEQRLAVQTALVERAVEAMKEIKDNYGKVCKDYELCEHLACASSYGAWAVADDFLAGIRERK